MLSGAESAMPAAQFAAPDSVCTAASASARHARSRSGLIREGIVMGEASRGDPTVIYIHVFFCIPIRNNVRHNTTVRNNHARGAKQQDVSHSLARLERPVAEILAVQPHMLVVDEL